MKSIKSKILNYLQEKRDWIYGGVIDDFIRQIDGHKASNCSRRCRELVNQGKIQRRLVSVDGIPNKVVQYKYAENKKENSQPVKKEIRSDIQPVYQKTLL